MSENMVYLLFSFGRLIKTPGEGAASCLGNSGFQSMSKGIVNNEQRDGVESRRYERKKRKITNPPALLQSYRGVENEGCC